MLAVSGLQQVGLAAEAAPTGVPVEVTAPGAVTAAANLAAVAAAGEAVPFGVAVPTSAPGAQQAAIDLYGAQRAADAVPGSAQTATSAPGATTATDQLRGTKGAADALPPSKTVTVGAPGATNATGQVDSLRGTIRDLIGKFVDVGARVSGASDVGNLASKIGGLKDRTVTVTTRTVNLAVADGAIFAGGVRSFAQGGFNRAREIARPAQARLQRGLAVQLVRMAAGGIVGQPAATMSNGPTLVNAPPVYVDVTVELDGRAIDSRAKVVTNTLLQERDARVRAGKRH